MSPRINYENELMILHDNLEEMGHMVEKNLQQLFRTLECRERENLEEVRGNDHLINNMERNIESKCLSLITKQQPVAGDLRVISATLKVVTDMERAGDQIVDIADLLLRMDSMDLAKYSHYFNDMVHETCKMVNEAVDAFISCNREACKKVIDADDVVDELFNKVKEDVISKVKENKISADECVDALMIAKHLEKISDHAVNVGEWGIFQETGNFT